WFPYMARLLNQDPGVGVGVHLTLTSEWDSIKWRPLTHGPTLVDENGYFPATNKAFSERKPALGEIENELRAQIETAKRLIKNVGWLWPHMGTATSTPELRELTLKLAHEYDLPLLGVEGSFRYLRQKYKAGDTAAAKTKAVQDVLESLSPGDWFYIDHPSTDTAESRAIGHAGYDHVAAERSSLLQSWADPALKKTIERLGIELISFEEAKAALHLK
ncbi:MAG: ChbG/HpnK family deacetylase, partial [Bryobacteraceae bacterium]|nr:ChbG/HpnK family deacetylase [Bryobacteraceae bacterium]